MNNMRIYLVPERVWATQPQDRSLSDFAREALQTENQILRRINVMDATRRYSEIVQFISVRTAVMSRVQKDIEVIEFDYFTTSDLFLCYDRVRSKMGQRLEDAVPGFNARRDIGRIFSSPGEHVMRQIRWSELVDRETLKEDWDPTEESDGEDYCELLYSALQMRLEVYKRASAQGAAVVEYLSYPSLEGVSTS